MLYLCRKNRTMKTRYVMETSKDYSLVDNHTGEILKYNQTRKVTLDEFIMVFFASYPELMELGGQPLKVLMACWKYSTYGSAEEGNVIINDKVFKEHVREHEPGMSDSSIDVAISQLSKKGLLLRQCRGRYVLNKEYFFKGKLSDRSKLKLEFVVDGKDGEDKPVRKAISLFCYSRILKEGEEVPDFQVVEEALDE